MILTSNLYDPQEDQDRRRPSHITKKDVWLASIVVFALLILFTPVYKLLKRQRDAHICTQNLQAIGTAVGLYQQDNNDRFPPVYVTDETGMKPRVFADGTVNTWVSQLNRYMSARASFSCPAADSEEEVINQNPEPGEGKPAKTPSTYGMYGALSAFPPSSIVSPSQNALIADTSSRGTNGSYDPMQFEGGTPDGFLIGLDNTNFTPGMDNFNRKLFASSKEPTRLAYPGSDKKGLKMGGDARHVGGIHFLMADFHLKTIPPDLAALQRIGKGELSGLWTVP